MPPDDPPDEFDALEVDAVTTFVLLLRLRLCVAFEKRFKRLETEVGRELPAVRAQLGVLIREAKELSAAASAPDPDADPPPPAPAPRKPGRPRKTPADIPSLSDDPSIS